ncbi:MAG: hypothetical protein ACK5KQ_02925 [Anaerorhabdus sp.]
MYPSTTVKHLNNGTTKDTIYYISKCRKISINEKILDELLNDILKGYISNNSTVNSKKLENLKQLYIMEDITLDEYKNMKKDLESKNSLNLSDIAKLNVNKNLNVTIHFTDGKIKMFQYVKKN